MPWATMLCYPTMLSSFPFHFSFQNLECNGVVPGEGGSIMAGVSAGVVLYVHRYAAALSLLAGIKSECFDYFLK